MSRGKVCPNIAGVAGPEFQFVLALCRAAACVANHAEIEHLLDTGLNWGEVLRIANVQRVLPMVSAQIRCGQFETRLPESAATALRAAAEESARQNLYLSKRLIDVLAALQEGGVSALPFKGPVLASRLYGNLVLRQSCDLDVLVRLRDLSATLDVLAECGFRPLYELTARQFKSMLDGGECEWSLFNADGMRLDLHWNVMARYFSVPINIDCFWDRRVSITFAGTTIQDLAPEDLLVSLALHARRHYWAKLIWIADIAQLLRHAPEIDLARTLERCCELRSQRILLLTLHLCRLLFESPLPTAILKRIAEDRYVEQLATWCMRNLELGLEADDSGLANYLFSLRSREHWRDRVNQVVRHVCTPGLAEWRGASTPPWLDIPLHLVRMGSKAARFATRRNTG